MAMKRKYCRTRVTAAGNAAAVGDTPHRRWPNAKSWAVYVSQTTAPFFITHDTFLVSLMSASGSPSNRIRSAI
jgi:hypothetical protein